MNFESERMVPPAIQNIIEKMVSRAVAECAQQGIALEEFYRAMQEEQRTVPKGTVVDLFEGAFRRLARETTGSNQARSPIA